MGEVKGGDFASCHQIWRMARHVKPKTDQLAAFFGSDRHKKQQPSQKEKPGDEHLRVQKALTEIKTYLVTFGAMPESLASKGL